MNRCVVICILRLMIYSRNLKEGMIKSNQVAANFINLGDRVLIIHIELSTASNVFWYYKDTKKFWSCTWTICYFPLLPCFFKLLFQIIWLLSFENQSTKLELGLLPLETNYYCFTLHVRMDDRPVKHSVNIG